MPEGSDGERGEGVFESESDDNDVTSVQCKCKTNCLSQFDAEHIQGHILSLREMEKDQKEMFVMGSLLKIGAQETRKGKRKRVRYRYTFDGKTVCKSVFCHINDIGQRTVKSLLKHLNSNGPVPRIHGNTGRKPSHAVKYEDVRFCVDFLLLYAEINGLTMPAAPRGADEAAPVLLPCNTTKVDLHSKYQQACVEAGVRCLGITTFKCVWKQCLPHIKIMTAKDDVCHKCEIIRKRVADAINEMDKLEAANDLREHIQDAQRERQVYRQTIEEAREEMRHTSVTVNRPAQPCTSDLSKVHYTFDYSQNVTIPHHSQQMGPLYFVTGRKIQIFGVRVDSVSQQYNYLIDEDESIGADGTGTHGPNSVISMLHHCLENQGFGEKACIMHADNCGSQNKNRFMLAYLAWRIHMGLHDEITLLMGIPGHTKCLVDGGFGHIKKLYRRTDCDSISQVASVVRKSASSNFPVLFRKEDGCQNWTWYDWKTFLPRFFLPLRGIQRYHYFRVTKDAVYVKERSTDVEQQVTILKRNATVPEDILPAVLLPGGLSRARQQYLYKNVRPFVRQVYRDVTCPPLREE
ncbi:uncharacterized protein LOC132734769 [Ruditapes philippinarum]|uniref:uncharacterized protein LOC132734769 n=1 Tax=Ruditapes philippinarum TaxID=129788 RepID=UPI00295C0173|nr:uncharacterized protein LOC132734769 [Ruditapes philippinarum]